MKSAYDGPVLYGHRDEDYWIKDSGDIEQIVQDLMEKCDYHDADFVRETLFEYNFDMASTVDVLLSMHVYLNGTETKRVTPEQKANASSITKYQNSQKQEYDANVVSDLEFEKNTKAEISERCQMNSISEVPKPSDLKSGSCLTWPI